MLCVNFYFMAAYNSVVIEFWPLPLEQRKNWSSFLLSDAHVPANVFHEVTRTTGALRGIPHDQNEQTIFFKCAF